MKLEFDWMFVWDEQPEKVLVNIEQQCMLSLPAVSIPTGRITAVAFDLAEFDLATSLPI